MGAKREQEPRGQNAILCEILNALTGFQFTDIEAEIIKAAVNADNAFNNIEFYQQQGEREEIKVNRMLIEYRKIKQR